MLQVEAMAFVNLAIYCLLHPCHFINHFIALLLKQIKGKLILGIDDPDEQEASILNLIKWHIDNIIVIKGVVGNSYTSCRIGS